MRCQGVASSPAQGVGHLIVYGIEGKQNDVDSAVYHALYVVDKGKMRMHTDLALNTHHIRGVSVDENDKTSAVSIAYLEDGGAKKRSDFRLPDTYGLVKIGNDYHVNAKVEKVGRLTQMKSGFVFLHMKVKEVCASASLYL